MGKVATLEVDLSNLEMLLTGKKKLLAGSEQNLEKVDAEKKKIATEMVKVEADVKRLEKAVKTAEATKKKDVIKKAKEDLAKASALFDKLRDSLDAASKKYSIVGDAEEKLKLGISALQKQITAKQQEIVKAKQDYAKNLKEYGDKKTALLNAYSSSAGFFKTAVADADKLAGEADQGAQEALAASGPDTAVAGVRKAETAVAKLEKLVGDAQKKEAELLKIFDPHRTGEKPDEYELEKVDSAPFAGIFAKADAFRKQFNGLVGEIEASLSEAKQSVAQAQTATLSSEKRLAEYLKLATAVKGNAEKAFGEVKGKISLQGIVGKNLAGQMNMWLGQIEKLKPEEAVEGKKKTLTTAKARMGQVETNEALMLAGFAAIARGVTKGAGGIPQKFQKESTEIKALLEAAETVVAEAKKYEQEWASEKKKGEAAFKELEKACTS